MPTSRHRPDRRRVADGARLVLRHPDRLQDGAYLVAIRRVARLISLLFLQIFMNHPDVQFKPGPFNLGKGLKMWIINGLAVSWVSFVIVRPFSKSLGDADKFRKGHPRASASAPRNSRQYELCRGRFGRLSETGTIR